MVHHPDWAVAGADWPNREASFFLRVKGVEWHVQRAGPAGRTLLLLHGTGASTHSWRDLFPLLAADFDVIAPDLPRHGFTRAPAMVRPSLPRMAGAVAELTSALGVSPDLVIGHSAGCAVALRMALDGAVAPSVIIGLNAALRPYAGVANTIFSPLAKLLALNPLSPWIFARLAGGEDAARRLIEGTGSRIDVWGLSLYARLFGRVDHVGGALAMMASWDLAPLIEDLPRLAVPLHLAVGMSDQAVSPAEARRLAERLPQATLHEIEGLGHLMHEEAPARIAALIASIAALARVRRDERQSSSSPRSSSPNRRSLT